MQKYPVGYLSRFQWVGIELHSSGGQQMEKSEKYLDLLDRQCSHKESNKINSMFFFHFLSSLIWFFVPLYLYFSCEYSANNRIFKKNRNCDWFDMGGNRIMNKNIFAFDISIKEVFSAFLASLLNLMRNFREDFFFNFRSFLDFHFPFPPKFFHRYRIWLYIELYLSSSLAFKDWRITKYLNLFVQFWFHPKLTIFSIITQFSLPPVARF